MRDLIVVIPGILGSVLEREGKEVWGLSREAMIGNLLSLGRNSQHLALPQGIGDQEAHDGVSATRLMTGLHLLPGLWAVDRYGRLVKGLKARFTLNEVTADQPGNLLLFPYDWRLSNVVSAGMLVSGGEDTTVRLWDARTGRPRGKPLTGHRRAVTAVALGEVDGEPVVVSGSFGDAVRLWDARIGRPRGKPLTGHRWWVNAVALGKVDGEPVVVSGGEDTTVRLWDARTGRPRGKPLTGHTGSVHALALGKVDGEPVVVSGGRDSTVRLWDARTGRPRGMPLTTGDGGWVNAVALGEVDGEPVVVSGGGDRTVRLWDARTGRPRGMPLTGHKEGVSAMALGEVDGEPVVVSGGSDETLRLWDARTFSLLRVVPLHSEISGLAMGKDSSLAVSATNGLLVLDFFLSHV